MSDTQSETGAIEERRSNEVRRTEDRERNNAIVSMHTRNECTPVALVEREVAGDAPLCTQCGDELTNDDVCSSCVPSVAERAKPQGDGEWTTADPPARIAFAVRKSDGLVNNMTQMVSRINAYARRVAELEADVAGWEQSFALFHAAHRALAELHEAAYPEMYEPREDGSVLGCIGGTALAEWAVAEIERLARERDEERAKIGDVEEDRDHYYRRGFDVGHAKAQAAVEQLQAISQTTTADCIDPESLDRYRRAREMATAEGISFRAALERVLRDAE